MILNASDGAVEFLPISKLVDRVAKIRWSDFPNSEFDYIDLSSVNRTTRRVEQTVPIDATSAPSRAQQIVRNGDILFGTTRPMLKRVCRIDSSLDGQIASTGFCVLRPNDRLLSGWLFHLLGTADFYGYVEKKQSGTGYPAISDSLVKRFVIPVPSIEVQESITAALDQFNELQLELEAELEARRQQYEYYLDSMLGFGLGRVECRRLEEVGTVSRGRRFTKSDLRSEGLDALHFGELYTRYDTYTHEAVSKVDPGLESSLRFAAPGDLIIAGVSETVEDIGKAVAWLGNGPVAVHDDCFFFSHDLNPKYVAYYFQTRAFHAEKARHVASGKIKRLSASALGSLSLPVPPRELQDSVVETLDQLHALINDLASGLPAEIAARRQQYEHYRDRLLTFDEAPAAL